MPGDFWRTGSGRCWSEFLDAGVAQLVEGPAGVGGEQLGCAPVGQVGVRPVVGSWSAWAIARLGRRWVRKTGPALHTTRPQPWGATGHQCRLGGRLDVFTTQRRLVDINFWLSNTLCDQIMGS